MASASSSNDPYPAFRAMESSREAPNPLRPYYIPPSIGIPQDTGSQNVSSAAPKRYTVRATSPPRPKNGSLRSSARDYFDGLDYADYLPDRSPSISEMVKRLMDRAIWNYTSILLAQPFEVAKTVLQVHLASNHAADLQIRQVTQRSGSYQAVGRPASPILLRMKTNSGLTPGAFEQGSYFEVQDAERDAEEDDDSDSDSPSYFTSAAPRATASPAYSASPVHSYPSHPSRQSSYQRQRKPPSRSHSTTPTPGSMPHARPSRGTKLDLKRSDAVLEVLGQLWQREAAWGVWKGTNITFVYNILLRTIEAWTRSVLAALMNLPEAGTISIASGGASLAASAGGGMGSATGFDILDSSSPWASLAVAVAAAGITGLALSPLDVLRTRLIVTPTSTSPRALLPSFRLLPSLSQLYHSLAPTTLLHSTIPSLISNSTPLFLRTFLRVDPILTPTLYSISSFGAAIAELFVRLPLETVLRRGQVAVLREENRRRQLASLSERSASRSSSRRGRSSSRETAASSSAPEMLTIVEPGPYKGVFGSMWFIVREEGYSTVGTASRALAASGADAGRAAGARGPGQQGKTRKGQGVKGLWRGWRVGFWGLVGVWGAAALNSGSTGGEF